MKNFLKILIILCLFNFVNNSIALEKNVSEQDVKEHAEIKFNITDLINIELTEEDKKQVDEDFKKFNIDHNNCDDFINNLKQSFKENKYNLNALKELGVTSSIIYFYLKNKNTDQDLINNVFKLLSEIAFRYSVISYIPEYYHNDPDFEKHVDELVNKIV